MIKEIAFCEKPVEIGTQTTTQRDFSLEKILLLCHFAQAGTISEKAVRV
jgi:hypothetical protein